MVMHRRLKNIFTPSDPAVAAVQISHTDAIKLDTLRSGTATNQCVSVGD